VFQIKYGYVLDKYLKKIKINLLQNNSIKYLVFCFEMVILLTIIEIGKLKDIK
jgi:hypothetical protein